jgi:hypothetical protein
MTIGSMLLAFLAGILSILSPCVLPLLPIVLGSAASSHRQGPWALAAGLSLSFVGIGLFVATVGHSIGLDADRLRYVAATLMMLVGDEPRQRSCRAVLDRRAPGSRVEPMRRADTWNRIFACRPRQGSRSGGADNACVRCRRGTAIVGIGMALPGNDGPLAWSTAGRGRRNEIRARSFASCHRHPHHFWSGQGA